MAMIPLPVFVNYKDKFTTKPAIVQRRFCGCRKKTIISCLDKAINKIGQSGNSFPGAYQLCGYL